MHRRFLFWFCVLTVTVLAAGCCCTHSPDQSSYFGPTRIEMPASTCDHCSPGPVAPPPARFGPAPIAVPAVPQSPPSASVQAGAFNSPAAALPVGPNSPPAPAGVQLNAPEPSASGSVSPPPTMPPAGEPADAAPRQPALLQPPEANVPTITPQPTTPTPPSAPPAAPPSSTPRSSEVPSATPPLPVDIPQFAMARPQVASGQEPMPEGIAWLAAHGYRTVLHIRAPGEDDAAARRLFEKNHLRYTSLEVSPRTLTPEVVERFNRAVTEELNLPLFVYDKDGSLAGGLWYLYFRLVERLEDEKARAEASRLGFRQDTEGSHREMWLAVQNFLATRKP